MTLGNFIELQQKCITTSNTHFSLAYKFHEHRYGYYISSTILCRNKRKESEVCHSQITMSENCPLIYSARKHLTAAHILILYMYAINGRTC